MDLLLWDCGLSCRKWLIPTEIAFYFLIQLNWIYCSNGETTIQVALVEEAKHTRNTMFWPPHAQSSRARGPYMNQNTSNLFPFDSWLLSWTMCSHNGSWHTDHNTAETLKGRGVITATFQKGYSKITTVQRQGSRVRKLVVKGSFKRLQTVVAKWANGGTGSWVSCQ